MSEISKRIVIYKQNLSVSLEQEYWHTLKEIATLEGANEKELLELIFRANTQNVNFEDAIKSFVYNYYRIIAVHLPFEQIADYRKKIKK